MIRVAVVLVAALAAGCGIDRRSDDFRCELPADCESGRTCVDGWCVGGDGDGGVDPGDGGVDALGCPAACDECVDGTCVIRCAGASACGTEIVCPADLPCRVECGGDNACAGGIDCSAATACTIDCTGPGSCGGGTTCGSGRCEVRCTASGSCAGLVDCESSCACDVTCSGSGACNLGASCPGPSPCDTGLGCTSQNGPCDACGG